MLAIKVGTSCSLKVARPKNFPEFVETWNMQVFASLPEKHFKNSGEQKLFLSLRPTSIHLAFQGRHVVNSLSPTTCQSRPWKVFPRISTLFWWSRDKFLNICPTQKERKLWCCQSRAFNTWSLFKLYFLPSICQNFGLFFFLQIELLGSSQGHRWLLRVCKFPRMRRRRVS